MQSAARNDDAPPLPCPPAPTKALHSVWHVASRRPPIIRRVLCPNWRNKLVCDPPQHSQPALARRRPITPRARSTSRPRTPSRTCRATLAVPSKSLFTTHHGGSEQTQGLPITLQAVPSITGPSTTTGCLFGRPRAAAPRPRCDPPARADDPRTRPSTDSARSTPRAGRPPRCLW